MLLLPYNSYVYGPTRFGGVVGYQLMKEPIIFNLSKDETISALEAAGQVKMNLEII